MKQRLRVASLIANLGFGGSENRLLSFARAIDRNRFDHTVISLYCRDDTYDREVGSRYNDYLQAGVDIIDLGERPANRLAASAQKASLFEKLAQASRMLFRLCSIIRDRKIDLIDAEDSTSILFGVLAGRLMHRPTTVTEYYTDYWDRPKMRLLGRILFRMADAFICDAKAQSDGINAWLGRPHPRTIIIQNGIPKPETQRSREEMLRHLCIPDSPEVRIVGQVGRLVPQKGQLVLIEAAKQVLEQAPETWILIVGFAPAYPEYHALLNQEAQKLGIAGQVRIVSYPGPIGDIWSVIDVHVHAALSDSLPISITEGMSWAKPAVVTRVGGIPEMVEHEKTGLLVPPGDTTILANSILRLLRDPQMAAQLGAAARLRYEEHHQPSIMARSLERLFEEIIRK